MLKGKTNEVQWKHILQMNNDRDEAFEHTRLCNNEDTVNARFTLEGEAPETPESNA